MCICVYVYVQTGISGCIIIPTMTPRPTKGLEQFRHQHGDQEGPKKQKQILGINWEETESRAEKLSMALSKSICVSSFGQCMWFWALHLQKWKGCSGENLRSGKHGMALAQL